MTPTLQALITASESKTTRILEKAEGVSAREIVAIIEAGEKMAVALKWYADAENYNSHEVPMSDTENGPDYFTPVMDDEGSIAEKALTAWTKAQPGENKEIKVTAALTRIQKEIDHASANFREIRFRDSADLDVVMAAARHANQVIQAAQYVVDDQAYLGEVRLETVEGLKYVLDGGKDNG